MRPLLRLAPRSSATKSDREHAFDVPKELEQGDTGSLHLLWQRDPDPAVKSDDWQEDQELKRLIQGGNLDVHQCCPTPQMARNHVLRLGRSQDRRGRYKGTQQAHLLEHDLLLQRLPAAIRLHPPIRGN